MNLIGIKSRKASERKINTATKNKVLNSKINLTKLETVFKLIDLLE